MLMPKRVKHRKQFRGSMTGKATRGNTLSYGEFGIVAAEAGVELKCDSCYAVSICESHSLSVRSTRLLSSERSCRVQNLSPISSHEKPSC